MVDTNIWVSAFITPRSYASRLKFYWQANRFDVLTSVPLLTELAEVLSRPRLQTKYKYSMDELASYVRLIAWLSDQVSVTGKLSLCRDPKDDILLETAIAGSASHVVSRDEDITRDTALFNHLERHGVKATTINRFLAELETAHQT